MDEYLAMDVKSVIEALPEVGEILDRYGIGCVSCSIGTCLLKDVVKLHALPAESEAALMAEVERAVAGEAEPSQAG
jgi:hypothetical protein